MPFLTIVTRTHKRPKALERCRQSVYAQSDQDLEHIIIRDTVGVGVAESHRLLLNAQPHGDYVAILDDDDLFDTPRVVSHLKAISAAHDPDVVVWKMCGPLGILPDHHVWEKVPKHGYIGGCNVAVKAHVWNACIGAIATDGQGGPPVYHSDLYYLEAIWAYTSSIYWWNNIVVRVPRVSRGEME
jgi:glycosyltransferase involved in cell wall biosynthesis